MDKTMELEFLLAKHRRKLEELKILNTFKYSGLVGILITAITKGLISPQLKIINLLLVIVVCWFVFFISERSIFPTKEKLKDIEIKIKELKK